jgi:hypothetical protein
MVLAACLAAAWAALPAAADWLVTTDGQRVETAGGWKVQGRLVVFKRPNGTLASIRLAEVDLEASRLATEEAARPAPPPPPPPPPKKPVLVLTDADVAHVTPEGEALPEEAAAEGAEATPQAEAPADAGGLEVTEWRQIDDPENLDVQILGTVTNTSRDFVTDLSVTVRLLGSGGALIAEKSASLSPNTLAAGGTVNFRAVFPGVVSFSSASFSVKGGVRARPIGVTPPPEPEAR